MNTAETTVSKSNTSTEYKEDIPLKQRMSMGVVCIFLFLLVYALSAGPMVKLLKVVDVEEFKTAVKFFYTPFVLLIENDIKPFSTLLKWYVSLF